MMDPTLTPRFEKLSLQESSAFRFSVFESPYFPFNWHYHPQIELVLIENCDGRRVVGDHIGRFSGEELVLIGSNISHSFDTDPNPNSKEPHKATVVHFSEDLENSDFMLRPEFHRIKNLLKRSERGILFEEEARKKIMPRLKELNEETGLQRLFDFFLLLDLMGEAGHCSLLASQAYSSSALVQDQSDINRVCNFIQSDFNHDIKLEDAADLLNMSISNFCHFFKKTTRTTFNSYLNQLRIGHACKLLIETEMPISRICFQSGFNTISNFNRRFLSLKELTPKDFRNKYRRKKRIH